MATIKDVARLAGVGLGTASRVLNGSIQVSPESVKKVMTAAKELEYRPNAAARALVKGDYTKHSLGVALPIAVHPFYLEILKGIYEGVAKKGYNILVFNLGDEAEAVYNHILQESLPGVLVVSRALPEQTRQTLYDHNIPFSYIDFLSTQDSCFYIDNSLGGIQAAEYFLSKGFNRIAYIGEDTATQQQDQRFSGFNDTLKKKGIQLIQDIRIPIDEEACRAATLQVLNDDTVQAVFYFCDELALTGLQVVQEQNRNVSVLGYDDREAAQHLGLSTIRQPAREMGVAAALGIIDGIENQNSKILQKVFSPSLIIRRS